MHKFKTICKCTVDDEREKIREFKKYKGNIALMCPKCFKYSFAWYNEYIDLELDSISFFNAPSRFLNEDGTGKYQVDPYYEISFSRASFCPNCMSREDLIQLDPNIAYAVSTLNKRGFYTSFSCEGHIIVNKENVISNPYIIFCNIDEDHVNILKRKFADSVYWEVRDCNIIKSYYDKINYKYYKPVAFLELKDDFVDVLKYKSKYIKELNFIVSDIYPDKSTCKKEDNKNLVDYRAAVHDILQHFRFVRNISKKDLIKIFIDVFSKIYFEDKKEMIDDFTNSFSEVFFKDEVF